MARTTTEKRDDSGNPAGITKGELRKLQEQLTSEKYERERLAERVKTIEQEAALARARLEGFKDGVREAASRSDSGRFPFPMNMTGRGPWG